MKAPHSGKFSANVITLAVQGALVAMFAAPLGVFAQGEANEKVTALTQPTNSVEIGVENTSRDSAKFGEYNGLNKSGTDPIGNFSVRGGDAYNAYYGGDGTNRWEIKGTDLGTTSRELSGNVSNQGKWSLGIGYDELRHNITDTYQTPFQGSMGGNNFTLPTTFAVISTTAPGTNSLTPTQKSSSQTQDVHTDRENTSFNAKYIFDSRWDVKFDFNHLAQSGAKLLGVAGEQGILGGDGNYTWAGQTPLVLMNPTNYTTDNFNLALNWVGDKGYVSTSYFGSMFRDGYNGLSFNNTFVKGAVLPGVNTTGTVPTAFPLDTMSTMPSNDFNQLSLSGGYAFTSVTKLVGGLSYGRNTQNDAYSASGVMVAGGLPQSSLNGQVVTTHADMKLTNQTTKDLLLSAGFKYNQRDNQTASNTYKWNDINEAAASSEASVNAPMSNKKTQLELAGDYRIEKSQKLRLSYEYEEIKRWCNNAAANNAQGSLNAAYSGIAAYSAATCAQVPDSKENKLAANYKLKASDDVSFSAGYGYSRRSSDISPSFYNPMQAVNTPVGTGSVGEGFEIPGFMAYFQTSRKEQLLKAGVNWQANEKFFLSLNGRYTDDKYDSTYGVQNGQSESLNLDATYSYDKNSSVSAYATTQNSSRDLTNLYGVTATTATATRLNIPVGGTWTNKLKESDTIIGLGTKKGGLMGGKLDLAGDLTYSLGKTGYGTQLNYANADTLGNTCSSAFYLTCGNLPDIKNEMVQLKLTGGYKIDKASKVMMGYIYQHLKSNDYFYNAYQFGSTPTTLLPTNQQAPSYSVNVVTVSYVYDF
jgi:MtrB/PioB family decaheme-associated outer membrane protein